MRFNGTALPLATQPTNVPQIGQLVISSYGPPGILQSVNNIVNAIVLQASLQAGCSYLVTARASGTVVTTNPNYIWARIQDTANYLQAYPVYIWSLSSAAYQVGNVIAGGISSVITAAASGVDTFALAVSASGSGAFQMVANSCELNVIRVA